MEGKIVEYIDAQKVITAICLGEKDGKLHLLLPQNREITLNKARVCLVSREKFNSNQPKDLLIKKLKEEITKRETLKEEIDVVSLWELLVSEGGVYTPYSLAEFYFPGTPSSFQESALFRALFREKIHFKWRGDGFEVLSPERVEEIQRQRSIEEERERKITEASTWFRAVWAGEDAVPPAESEEYIRLLKEWCFWQEEAPQAKITKEIIQRAGLNKEEHPFLLLVKLGVFSKHENILLHRFRIPTRFSEEIKAASQILIKNKPAFFLKREDLRSIYTFTIDGPETRDFDDALSFETKDGHYLVGVHITDLTPFIKAGDPLDEEAKERGTTVYLPDGRIPMFPEAISENLASLKKGEAKPALSFLITLNADAEILDYKIIPSIIEINRHFTYEEVNNLLTENETLHTLYQLALKLRAKRTAQGGMVIALPELVILFLSENTIEIRQRDPEQPSRILVAEFMILANYLAASFMDKEGVPGLYRFQLPPRERVMNGTSRSIFTLYLQRKLLNRSQWDTKPEFHHIVGLDKYTSVTSPLRRYIDLIIQRQIVHYLQKGEPLYSEREFSSLIPQVEEILRRVNTVCIQRLRYWILTYLKQHVKEQTEAYVLEELSRGYRLLLPDYLLEADLNVGPGKFRRGDKVRIRIESVNPLKETLKVGLA
ncbi:MAG: RNB domain-containing ribonuclease [Candidatus Desulfofervidaceae bacterium]|nr:RNB domain-containing ribonuclease [Candidatus Desulfofervidaceae bacterium]